jgi:hypothetical protein
MNAEIDIKEEYSGKPMYVVAKFQDGVQRFARYSPSEIEKDKAAFMDPTY